MIVSSEIGGKWSIIKKENHWSFIDSLEEKPSASVEIAPQDAWLLFSKGMSPIEALEKVNITGDIELGKIALNVVAVMA